MCYVLSQKIKIGNAILFWTLPWWHGTDGIFVFRLAFAFAFAFVLPRFTPVGIERKRKCKLTKIKKCFNSLRWTELAFAFPWGWFISVNPFICVCICIARVTPMLKKKRPVSLPCLMASSCPNGCYQVPNKLLRRSTKTALIINNLSQWLKLQTFFFALRLVSSSIQSRFSKSVRKTSLIPWTISSAYNTKTGDICEDHEEI